MLTQVIKQHTPFKQHTCRNGATDTQYQSIGVRYSVLNFLYLQL